MAMRFKRVMVTGGAGYVGSRLIPKLLDAGYGVNVLDMYIYGEDIFANLRDNPLLKEVKGDIRDGDLMRDILKREGIDTIVHFAAESHVDRSIHGPDPFIDTNVRGTHELLKAARAVDAIDLGAQRSVRVGDRGDVRDVTEDLSLTPLTDYSKYKALCEKVLAEEHEPGFVAVTLRPATVCGYAPRLRLDLTVNILTSHAVNNNRITVFGGEQLRPNLHVEDMTDLYLMLLDAPDEVVDRKVWNAGYQNLKVREIADMVRDKVGPEVEIAVTPTDDHRSYHVSSEKIRRRSRS